ncbi:hypothetical protein M405DRAFT_885168 [Rhizopogon salebrosus TDB-379]|nr:hypothetical protein M405DRAFT_885168 [Rhizopogon salebrosus TDB-379]
MGIDKVARRRRFHTAFVQPWGFQCLNPPLRLILLATTASECAEAAEHANRFLPTATLTLLTKKIASQTGDVRALFEVFRGVIDFAITGSKVLVADANPLATPLPRPDHILAALKAYLPSASTAHSSSASTPSPTSSETVSKVHTFGLQVRLALLWVTLLASNEFSDLVGMLETVGLVSSSSAGSADSSPSKTGRRALGRAASFGVVKGAAAGQDIKLTETIRVGEVLVSLMALLMAMFSDIDKGNIHDIILVGVRSYCPYREALV